MKKIIGIILVLGSLLLSGCTAVEPNRKYNTDGVQKEETALVYSSVSSYLSSMGEGYPSSKMGVTNIRKINNDFFVVPGNGTVEVKEGEYKFAINWEKEVWQGKMYLPKDAERDISIKSGEEYVICHNLLGERVIIGMECNKISKIRKAITDNNKEEVLKIIKEGININEQDAIGRTPLMYAALYNKTDIVKELIKLGADIEKEDKIFVLYNNLGSKEAVSVDYNKKALDYAYTGKVKYKNELMLKNEVEKMEETPFDVIAKEYIKIGKYNRTLGEYVVSLEDCEKLKNIIELKDVKLKEILEYANQSNYKNSIEIISEKMINKKENLEEVMYYAIQKDNKEMVKKVINAGKNINEIEVASETTPLILAVKRQNIEMIKYLIQLGAKDKVKNEKIKSAVSYAVKYPNMEILKELIKSGGKITEEEIKTVQGKDIELDEMLKDSKNIIKG